MMPRDNLTACAACKEAAPPRRRFDEGFEQAWEECLLAQANQIGEALAVICFRDECRREKVRDLVLKHIRRAMAAKLEEMGR